MDVLISSYAGFLCPPKKDSTTCKQLTGKERTLSGKSVLVFSLSVKTGNGWFPEKRMPSESHTVKTINLVYLRNKSHYHLIFIYCLTVISLFLLLNHVNKGRYYHRHFR